MLQIVYIYLLEVSKRKKHHFKMIIVWFLVILSPTNVLFNNLTDEKTTDGFCRLIYNVDGVGNAR